MYFSRIELDMNKRKTLGAFSAPNIIHGALENCFHGERQRKLWRIDKLGGKYYLLIVSNQVPEINSFIEQFGVEPKEKSFAVKDYQNYLDRISNGDVMRFRLTANPTVRKKSDDTTNNGQIKAHITPKYQKDWLIRKSTKLGFQLDENRFDITNSRWFRFRKHKGGNRITLLAVSFEGCLTVQNAEVFKNTLVNGIGREKAYGLGLMTVIRQNNE